MRALIAMTLMMSGPLGCDPSARASDAGCDGAVKNPANLMRNGGFECDLTQEWMGVNGTLTQVSEGVSEGGYAAKVVSDASGTGGVGSTRAVVAATSGKVYCASAKVRGTVADVRLEVFGSKLTSFASPLRSEASWVRLPPSTNLEIREPADQTLYVKVRAQGASAGQTLFVDDIDLWESTAGACHER